MAKGALAGARLPSHRWAWRSCCWLCSGDVPKPFFLIPWRIWCSWPCCVLLLSQAGAGHWCGWRQQSAPWLPRPQLCLSRNLYKSKPMFPFKLTKAEKGAREAL